MAAGEEAQARALRRFGWRIGAVARSRLLLPLAIQLALPGCVANALVDVATAPVKVAGKAADWATTSQSEADRNRGRALRRQEERIGRLRRSYDRHFAECNHGLRDSCQLARDEYHQIEDLSGALPVEPAR